MSHTYSLLYGTRTNQLLIFLQGFSVCYSPETQSVAIAMQYHVPYTIHLHTGNTVPFLYTPTSLLPEHSVLTDVQQATGRNGQQWITCRSWGQGPKPEIWMENNAVAPSNSTANSATIGLGTHHPNGLYHCLSAQSKRKYVSLFLRTPGTVHA